jgi:hypothetical protein
MHWPPFTPRKIPCCTHIYLFICGLFNDAVRSWDSMISGSVVPTAWHILRLQTEGKATRYRGQLRIYWISSHRQQTRDGSSAWMLDEVLITHHKNHHIMKCYIKGLRFGQIIWNNLCNGKRTWDLDWGCGLNSFGSGQVPVAALVNVVMNLQIGKRILGISWVGEQLLASQEGLSSMELVK